MQAGALQRLDPVGMVLLSREMTVVSGCAQRACSCSTWIRPGAKRAGS
jgi:hypothetical protein